MVQSVFPQTVPPLSYEFAVATQTLQVVRQHRSRSSPRADPAIRLASNDHANQELCDFVLALSAS